MAGSADPTPLLALLAEAAAQGRPALALTRRRVTEVLGAEPDERWWLDRTDIWLETGWRAEVGSDVVTFLPADPGAPETDHVRITVTWARPDARARVLVDGREADLADPDVRELARLAAQIRAAARDGGGGSGI